MIGELIGNFRIVSRVGEGGMGEVFFAEQQQIRTKVAIKMLLGKISENHDIVQRFFNEAIAVSKIQHSGIVKIFDVGFHGTTGRAYLVMEFLDGETLSSRIKRGRMTIPEIADVGRQISSVLDAVNKAGITHRDLKPDNIFLVPDAELPRGERVKILDFGIAKLTGAGVGMTSTSASSMGTPLYMSPEQWMSSAKVDWRADAYSLGCVVFEMLTGRPPFGGESIGALCSHHLTTPAPRVSETVPVPPQLDDLVARLLSKAPEDRPASMREIGSVFTSLDGAAPSSAYSAAIPAHSASLSAQASAMTGAPAMSGYSVQSSSAAVPPTSGAANTTLGAAASSADVSRRKSRAVPIALGVVLAAGAGVAAFQFLRTPSTSSAPAVAATTPPSAVPPSAVPPSAPPPSTSVAAVVDASVTEDAARVAAVEDKPAETPVVDKTTEKPADMPAGKAVEKPTDKKPAGKSPVERKPVERKTNEKPPVEKPPVVAPTPPPVAPPPPDPNLPEKITRPMIKGVIATLKGKIEVCRAKQTTRGTVLVQVGVHPDGSLGDVVFLRTPDVGVSKCVLTKLQEFAKFPPTKTGGTWKALFDVQGSYVPDDVDDAPTEAPKRNRAGY